MEFLPFKKSYELKSRQIERAVFRSGKINEYRTAKGKSNFIERITKKTIAFRTEKSQTPNIINRISIRRALNYVFYKKTATRKELQQFSEFTSSLMGLLKEILKNITKYIKTPTGEFRITVLGCRYFFSGMERASKTDWGALVRNKVEFILMSYFHLRDASLNSWKDKISVLGLKILLDCGEYSVFSKKQKGELVEEIDIYKYADFIKEHNDVIWGFFNLDVTGDPQQTSLNFKLLKELTGQAPIPIWHCNPDNWKESDWYVLDSMVQEDHAIIALGATVPLGQKAGPKNSSKVKRSLFQEVFRRHPNQNFHWLGGSSNLMLEFPFFSADSQGWRQGRSDKKQIYTFTAPEKATSQGPEDWTKEKCLDFNAKVLSSIEQMTSEGLQLSFDMILPV